jgi:hypothetical protein
MKTWEVMWESQIMTLSYLLHITSLFLAPFGPGSALADPWARDPGPAVAETGKLLS